MKERIKKYLNIYFIIGFIGVFSVIYMFSFALVLNDVKKGSSVEIYKAAQAKQNKQ